MALHPEPGAHSFVCPLQSLMQRPLAESALWPMVDTSSDAAGLQDAVERPVRGHAVIADSMAELCQRDGLQPGEPDGLGGNLSTGYTALAADTPQRSETKLTGRRIAY